MRIAGGEKKCRLCSESLGALGFSYPRHNRNCGNSVITAAVAILPSRKPHLARKPKTSIHKPLILAFPL